MRSRCLDRLRATRTRIAAAQHEARLGEPISHLPERLGELDVLRDAFAELPEPQRAVLALGYFERLSCSEIAHALQIPIGTVKTRAARGLQEQKLVLQGTFIDNGDGRATARGIGKSGRLGAATASPSRRTASIGSRS